ncbi:hypothetical protein C8F04DRAFT_1258223 [Mycena alexandri]|uniref:Uncharacterized protein n=1 Tax=Mycena alexandri TaxID=1745969 RepID=A0AAD6WTR8_9AGAR|nr:hypothetical protein C8F04DRAFT_1267737 [Mycena alexandri]KAJ7036104.1 hypothetical protein C8F04DRAFT_1258223 [Mycena alexandri]
MSMTTFDFVVPELEEIANLDKGIKGKTAIVYLNTLVVQVMVGTPEAVELFKTIAKSDQQRLAQTTAIVGAQDAASHEVQNREKYTNMQFEMEKTKDSFKKSLEELEHREDEHAKLIAKFDEAEANRVETVERMEEKVAATSLALSKEKEKSMEWKAKEQEKYNQLEAQAKAFSQWLGNIL